MTKITPYYQDDSCTIYHGDCREILPTLEKVDLVLTDPPYGIALDPDNARFSGGSAESKLKRGSLNSKKRSPIVGDEGPFDASFLTNYGTERIVFGWNNFPDSLPRGSCLVWIKRNDAAFGSFLSDAEIAHMSKGCGVYCKRDLSNNAITREREHPTQKPVSLMAWCLGLGWRLLTITRCYNEKP
jgi:site-specific DNA-methyltransferase (adenine-specific)/modification methylase